MAEKTGIETTEKERNAEAQASEAQSVEVQWSK